MKKILSILVLSPILMLMFAVTANADAKNVAAPQTIPCTKYLPCITQETQAKGNTAVTGYITGTFGGIFFRTFLGISGVASVIFIIVGGMQMHLGMGNEEMYTKAKKTVTWAIAGLVISILSLAAIQIISNIGFK